MNNIEIGQKINYFTIIDGPIKKKSRKYWKCQCECGTIKEVRDDILKSGTTKSCGCYKNKILAENSKKKAVDITNKRFGKLVPIEPTSERTKDGRVIWKCQCDCGNICYIDTHSLSSNKVKSCGCLRSYGQYVIREILKENNISFIEEYCCKDCLFTDTGYPAIFDFYVNNSYFIEYDGLQHFKFFNSDYTWNNKQNFLKVQKHDLIKNEWCKENNIPLIRIPYTHLSEIELKDLLLESSNFKV